MWRYYAAGVFIALFTITLVLLCYEAGVFECVALYLHNLYAGIPILTLPAPSAPVSSLQYGAVIAVAFGVSALSTDNINPKLKVMLILVVISVTVASSIVLAM